MKRISVLALMFMFLLSCTAFAANWKWIDSNDTHGFFFDADTTEYGLKYDFSTSKYYINKNEIIFWEKIIYTQEAANKTAKDFNDDRYYSLSYSIAYVSLSVQDKTLTPKEETYYDKNGSVIERYNSGSTQRVIPDTMGESVYNTITNYAKSNDFVLARNTTH